MFQPLHYIPRRTQLLEHRAEREGKEEEEEEAVACHWPCFRASLAFDGQRKLRQMPGSVLAR